MQKIDGVLRLSASDLMRHKVCAHASTLELHYLERRDIVPTADGDEAELLQQQGDQHEFAFLEDLKAQGRKVVEIPKAGLRLERSVELTLEAMAQGPDVIFQGAVRGTSAIGNEWGGYTDFLERVDGPSALWDWSYAVADTKLKRRPDSKHVLQLGLYSDLLAEVQGVAPEEAHLQLGDGSRFSVRLAVSSNSHAAITNVLEAVAARAAAEGLDCRIVQKASPDERADPHPGRGCRGTSTSSSR